MDTRTDDTTTATVLESASAEEPAIREVEEVSEPVAPVSAPTGTQVNQEPQSQASTPPASPAPAAPASSSSRPRRAGTVSVRSVYDGDTFTLSDGSKIRLASVNTPELRPAEPYAVEARNAAELFMKGAQVALDPNPPQDSYGRIISQAYVDGESLSEHLVSLGLAHVFLIPPLNENHDIPALLAAQEQAREANRGIWSTEDYRGDLHITSFHANAAGDDRENINGEYLRLCNITSLDLNVDGYYISDASGGKWMFPSVIIPAGHTLKVHSAEERTRPTLASNWPSTLATIGPSGTTKKTRPPSMIGTDGSQTPATTRASTPASSSRPKSPIQFSEDRPQGAVVDEPASLTDREPSNIHNPLSLRR